MNWDIFWQVVFGVVAVVGGGFWLFGIIQGICEDFRK